MLRIFQAEGKLGAKTQHGEGVDVLEERKGAHGKKVQVKLRGGGGSWASGSLREAWSDTTEVSLAPSDH